MVIKERLAKLIWVLAIGLLAEAVRSEEPSSNGGAAVGAEEAATVPPLDEPHAVPLWRDPNRWSFQGGVGFITGSTLDDMGSGDFRFGGDSGGQIYLLQASLKMAKLDRVLWGCRLEMDLEWPLVFGVVDERGNDPFVQYSSGLTVRWKRFPWNGWLYTNFETGVGMTYSQHVLATERERHPTRERSHLEFYWPLQLTFAHPRHRQHQMVLFIHHHSGGGIFHRGGANSVGLGYRYVAGER